MAETIVFFPKYTALVTGTYYSDPYDVTSYKTVDVQTQTTATIVVATVSVQMQESSDLITWNAVGAAMDPAAPDLESVTLSDTARYVRAVATIGGAGSTAVIWVKAVARGS